MQVKAGVLRTLSCEQPGRRTRSLPRHRKDLSIAETSGLPVGWGYLSGWRRRSDRDHRRPNQHPELREHSRGWGGCGHWAELSLMSSMQTSAARRAVFSLDRRRRLHSESRVLSGVQSTPQVASREARRQMSPQSPAPQNNGLHQTRRGGAAASRPVVEARLAGEAECWAGEAWIT